MSGPKVVKIVTREEMEKRCQAQVARLENEIQQLRVFSDKNGRLDEKLEADLASRLQRFKEQDVSQYRKMESQISAQLSFLKSHRKDLEKSIEEQALSSRKSFNMLLRIRTQLLDYCAAEGLQVPDSIVTRPSGILFADVDLEAFRRQVNEAHATIFPRIEAEESAPSSEQKNLGERLGRNLLSLSFEQWKNRIENLPDSLPHSLSDSPQVARLTRLLAQLKTLEEGDSVFASFSESVNRLFDDIDNPFNVMRSDSLILDIIDCMEKTKLFKEKKDAARNVLLEIEVYLPCGSCDDLDAREYENLRDAFANCETAAIEPLIERASQLRDKVKEQFESRSRRQVILQGLADLGYKVNENLETAWVKEGSLVLGKKETSQYGLELVGQQALDKCQVRVVGSGNSSDTRNREADTAAEQKWCEDFASMRENLSNSGAEVTIQKAILPGQAALKVYAEGDDRWQKRSGVQEKGGRYIKPENSA